MIVVIIVVIIMDLAAAPGEGAPRAALALPEDEEAGAREVPVGDRPQHHGPAGEKCIISCYYIISCLVIVCMCIICGLCVYYCFVRACRRGSPRPPGPGTARTRRGGPQHTTIIIIIIIIIMITVIAIIIMIIMIIMTITSIISITMIITLIVCLILLIIIHSAGRTSTPVG